MNIEAVDLFCGIGGLTLGLCKAKINVLAGLDNDKSCEFAYTANNDSKFILADVSDYDFNKLKRLYSMDSIKVLVGCAPCQPFSTHTQKAKNKGVDIRWNLLDHFTRGIEIIKPHIVSMENVRGITKTDVFQRFIKLLEKMDYEVDHKIVYCPDYGIPQSRSRLVLLASRLGKIDIPNATHNKGNYKTVEKTIKKLPPIESGTTSRKDALHKAKGLSSRNIRRIKCSKPKGTWKDWDERLLPDCYKRRSGQTYTSVYGRMSWDDVSPTITTQFFNYGSGRFGHPEQNRALSIREGALLQTFPASYDFGTDISMTRTGRHIGNAVPPRLGYVIGQAIIKHVHNYHNHAE